LIPSLPLNKPQLYSLLSHEEDSSITRAIWSGVMNRCNWGAQDQASADIDCTDDFDDEGAALRDSVHLSSAIFSFEIRTRTFHCRSVGFSIRVWTAFPSFEIEETTLIKIWNCDVKSEAG
jgi:hypothetical protein